MPAPKGNKNAIGNKGGGRPSSYRPEFVKIAEEMCKLGATDFELAKAFSVCTATINEWRNRHVEFSSALKNGKEPSDERVERSLFQKACGYTFESEKIFNYQGEVVRATCIEHVPPDTTAAIFWLKNRRKEVWRDKHEVESTQTVNVTVTHVRDQLSRKLTRIASAGAERGLAEQPIAGRA